MKKNILAPIDTTQTTPGLKNAACEPLNWQTQGEANVKAAVAANPTKNPICPKTLQK
jgi:hypothetical protein